MWEHIWEHIDRILDALAALVGIMVVVFPFLFRWFVRINSTYQFSKALAENHLPHVYRVQRMIAKKLGVDVEDDPNINFADINGHDK